MAIEKKGAKFVNIENKGLSNEKVMSITAEDIIAILLKKGILTDADLTA